MLAEVHFVTLSERPHVALDRRSRHIRLFAIAAAG